MRRLLRDYKRSRSADRIPQVEREGGSFSEEVVAFFGGLGSKTPHWKFRYPFLFVHTLQGGTKGRVEDSIRPRLSVAHVTKKRVQPGDAIITDRVTTQDSTPEMERN